jgi:hypothetical protein
MISQTHDTRTPREWLLLKPETRVASLILEAIDLHPSARDQADAIWSIYRDYAQSDAARSVGIGESADAIVQGGKRLLREAVASALLSLAEFDRLADRAVLPLQDLARERVTG